MELLDLHDYFLDGIIKYLTYEDMVQFAKTCQRISNIFYSHYLPKLKHMRFNPNDDVTGLSKLVPNVISLHIRQTIGDPDYELLLEEFSLLPKLKFLKIDVGRSRMHHRIAAVFRGDCLFKFNTLQEFELRNCPKMYYENFNRFFQAAKDLKKLKLTYCNDYAAGVDFGRYCQNVDDITLHSVGFYYERDNIATLTKVKKLSLSVVGNESIVHIIKMLGQRKAALECLEVEISDRVDMELGRFIAYLPHLKSFTLTLSYVSKYTFRALGNFRHLNVLRFWCTPSLNYDIILEFIKTCESIEELIITPSATIKISELRSRVEEMLEKENKKKIKNRRVLITFNDSHSQYAGISSDYPISHNYNFRTSK